MFVTDQLLNEIHERAPMYDKTNQFPHQDIQALIQCGYTKLLVPKEYGGYGYTLAQVAHEQTRLAMAAPATALAINMHHVIVGMAKYMVEHDNMQGVQILEDAARGALIAFAISEPSNDRVLFGSNTEARVDTSGYFFNGRKVFISMIKECTHLVTYGQAETTDGPQSVFAYIKNNPEVIVCDDTWDTLGMRATQSHNMELKDAYASHEQILSIVNPGPSFDPVVFGIFSYFEILLAATYHGIGKRAIELGIEAVKTRKSYINNAPYDKDKDIRWRIAEAAILVDAVELQIEGLAHKLEQDYDYGKFWMPKLSALKNNAVETSKKAVDEIIRASGGRSYYNDQELSRLLRDVYAGLFQPSDQESLHGAWAQILLGAIK